MLRNLRLLGTFLVLWAVPVGVLYLWRGGNDVFVEEALFFTGTTVQSPDLLDGPCRRRRGQGMDAPVDDVRDSVSS
jgi:hypothetical protein